MTHKNEYILHEQVLAAAKRGFQAHGIELNVWLVWYSRFKALLNGVSSKTAFFKQDLWKYNLGKYNNIVIFGVDQMVRNLCKQPYYSFGDIVKRKCVFT